MNIVVQAFVAYAILVVVVAVAGVVVIHRPSGISRAKGLPATPKFKAVAGSLITRRTDKHLSL